MIVDIRSVPDGTAVEADLCILGGGPSAIAMALQLSGTRLTVAILESGGVKLEAATQALTGGEQSGLPYFSLAATRFRLLGGSTIHWGARSTPLKAIDFTARDWVPHSGWPISQDTLAPYYDRVIDLVGLHHSFRYDADVWKLFTVSPPAVDPSALEYAAFQFGTNLLLGDVYREPLRAAPNVTVYLHATVRNIRSNPRGDHVEGVEAVTLAGQAYTFKARTYVLACGGIENARLLLLSNAAHPGGLCNEHDGVGRYFMEHPTVLAGTIVSGQPQQLQDVFSPGLFGGRLVEVGLALSSHVQRTRRCLNGVARPTPVVTRDSTQALRELLWFFKHRRLHEEVSAFRERAWFSGRVMDIARDPFGIVANAFRHTLGKPNRFRVDSLLLQVRTEQEPNPNSRVTLSGATDALGQRRAHLHWELTERDKLTMHVTAETFDAELRRLGLGEVRLAPWLTSNELVWPADMVGGHHHMGTTRMSDDPRSGIVNADCRAHAVDNLYIAGSSVFPTAGYANPTMTLLALAVRLSDHLRARSA